VIDLARVFAALDHVRDQTGALVATTTFYTSHGLVSVASGPDGRVVSVNGERVPLDDDTLDDEEAAA
jgi:hypothetical protein